MRTIRKSNTQRKSLNLTADVALVERVRAENGNLSALLEESMIAFLESRELERWKKENKRSFDSYNKMVGETGLISDDLGVL